MKVYVPVYTTKKEIWQIDTDEYKKWGNDGICRYKKGVGFYGSIISNRCYETEQEAIKYWRGEYAKEIKCF